MNIFQNLKNRTKLDKLREILLQIQEKFSATQVYYLEFEDNSSLCIKHIGIDKDCSSFHKVLVDKIERVVFEEGIPVVIMDTSKDPRTVNSSLSEGSFSLLSVPVKIKNYNVGTLTVVRDKKFDIKDLNDLYFFAESISSVMEAKIEEFDKNLVLKEIAGWFFRKQNFKEDGLIFEEFSNFIGNLGLNIEFGLIFKDGKVYKSLPCDIFNWEALVEICPAVKKDRLIDCESCKFAKRKGFFCKSFSLERNFHFVVISFSKAFSQEFNEIIIDILSKFCYWNYSIRELDSVFLYERVMYILNEFVSTDKVGLDNVIIKLADVMFDLFDNAAIYGYSLKSKYEFEFIRINGKYQNFSELIYSYCRGNLLVQHFPVFSRTFSFSVKSKDDKIIFDIIFVNSSRKFYDISRKIEIIKKFLEFVSFVDFYIDFLKDELKDKKEEIKYLYSRNKKLDQEIVGLHKKVSELTARIDLNKFKENVKKYINSIHNFVDFEKKFNDLIEIMDDYVSYKIVSSVVLFFNKVLNKFERIVFWNIPEYLSESIRSRIREIEKFVKPENIMKLLFSEGVIDREDEIFRDLFKNFVQGSLGFYLNKIKSIVNIPLFLGDDKVASIMLFFNTKVELSEDEKFFISFVSKELSKKFVNLRNNEKLEKVKYVYALFQDFLDKLHFQNNTSIKKIFDYLQVIFSKMGLKNLLIYKEKKEFFIKNYVEFELEYCDSYGDKNFPSTLRVSSEVLYLFDKIKIFVKDRDYDSKYEFIEFFWVDNTNIIFFIPFSNVTTSQFIDEYCNYFALVSSDLLDYTHFDVNILVLIRKLLSLFYDNVFLYNVNVRDKKVLSEVFKVMEDGIIVMDIQKRVLHINRSVLKILEINHNFEEMEKLNYSVYDLFSNRGGDLIERILHIEDLVKQYVDKGIESIEGEGILEIEDRIKVIKYSLVLLKYPMDYVSFMHENEDSFSYLIVLRDITEQRNMEKEKDDFVATISHDIKTPLTTMKGYLSALLRYSDKITSEQRDSYLRVVNSEIDRINRMLNNLMDLRKLEGNILKINPVKFDLLKTIKKVLDIFKFSYVNFEFEILYEKENLIISADKDKIEQVLHNLLSNAVKYSPVGGKIFISIQKNKSNVIVGVSDQGIGIPEEEIDKVFEKYYRTKETLKKKVSGKGLGLYITKKIIELHGGKIWVESKVNKGTTFFFSLPI